MFFALIYIILQKKAGQWVCGILLDKFKPQLFCSKVLFRQYQAFYTFCHTNATFKNFAI